MKYIHRYNLEFSHLQSNKSLHASGLTIAQVTAMVPYLITRSAPVNKVDEYLDKLNKWLSLNEDATLSLDMVTAQLGLRHYVSKA